MYSGIAGEPNEPKGQEYVRREEECVVPKVRSVHIWCVSFLFSGCCFFNSFVSPSCHYIKTSCANLNDQKTGSKQMKLIIFFT